MYRKSTNVNHKLLITLIHRKLISIFIDRIKILFEISMEIVILGHTSARMKYQYTLR